jgi:hypothetical protein
MGVSKRVGSAFAELLKEDAAEALFHICAAIEATAKQESGKSGRASFKGFIDANIALITRVGIGIRTSGLRLGWSHPDLPTGPAGDASFADIVYHVVRCGFYHQAEISSNIVFTDRELGSDAAGQLMIPRMLVAGLILAVVAAPSNASGTVDATYFVDVDGVRLNLQNCWGTRDQILVRIDPRGAGALT